MRCLRLGNNRIETIEAVDVSRGPQDAGKLVRLNSEGKLDPSLLNLALDLNAIVANLSIVPPLAHWTLQSANNVYYCPMALTGHAVSTINLVSGVIYWYPFFVWRKCRIEQFVVRITSASSSSGPNYVGIYNSREDFNPDRLLTLGSYTSNFTGTRPFSPDDPPYLDVGVYWIALLPTTGHTITAISSSGARSFALHVNFSSHILFWRSSGYTELPQRMLHPIEPFNFPSVPCVAIARLTLA